MWQTIEDLVRGGSTVLLTTQYMEEADRLADDIVVIDRGRKIAQGTAEGLKRQIGGERIGMVLADGADLLPAETILAGVAVDEVQADEHARRLTAGVAGGADDLRVVLQQLSEANIGLIDVGLHRPTLDDVFLSLTGHHVEDVELDREGDEDGEERRREAEEKEMVR